MRVRQRNMSRLIAIANDHAGVELKNTLSTLLSGMGYVVDNLGADSAESVDYPDYAHKMAGWIKQHDGAMGVLICGSGIGISIAANRYKHIRAALCTTGEAAKLSRQHNNANVLCLGARLISADTAKECLQQFVATAFEGGRHQKRIDKL